MRRILSVFIMALVVLAGIDYLCCAEYCRHVLDDMAGKMDSSGGPFDAAVVLFGDVANDLATPGAETMRRIDHAETLFKDDIAENIICVGGNGFKSRYGLYGANSMRDILVERGVAPERVFADTLSFDTDSNWREARRIIDRHGWKRIVIVSSLFHLHRIIADIPPSSLEIAVSPYSLKCIDGPVSFWTMREWIHHEWLVWSVKTLVPENAFRRLITFSRSR